MDTNSHNQISSIQNAVLDKIKAGEAKMRPRWHYALKAVLILIGLIMVALAALYVASLSLFVMRENGALFAPAFGWRGMHVFFVSIPWILILLCIAFVIILELLVKHYAFAYRRPLLYSVAFVLLFTLFGSIFVVRSGLHENMYRQVVQKKLPVAGPLYRSVESHMPKRIHPGIVLEINDQGFTMQRRDKNIIFVIVTPRTHILPPGVVSPKEEVVVFGEKNGGGITAFGVRRIGIENFHIFGSPMHHRLFISQ